MDRKKAYLALKILGAMFTVGSFVIDKMIPSVDDERMREIAKEELLNARRLELEDKENTEEE